MKPVVYLFFLRHIQLKWLGGLFLIFSNLALAQRGEIDLVRFELIPSNTQIFLRFGLAAGNICNGIGIERSPDGVHFETVGEIPGVCGQPDSNQYFTFVDPAPKANRRNFYRLEFGGFGHSDVVEIFWIPDQGKAYVITQDLHQQLLGIWLNSVNGTPARIDFFLLSGQKFFSKEIQERPLNISTQGWKPGTYLYFIWRREGEIAGSGKLIII